jgi:hypothetical protein
VRQRERFCEAIAVARTGRAGDIAGRRGRPCRSAEAGACGARKRVNGKENVKWRLWAAVAAMRTESKAAVGVARGCSAAPAKAVARPGRTVRRNAARACARVGGDLA